MSRDDLLLTNMKIVTSVVGEVVKHSPDSVLVVVTNPLDAMVQRAFQISGFPKNRVVGMAGILDTARFRTFLAQELGVSVESVSAFVLGGHGDTMVPVVGSTSIGGRPIAQLLPPERIEQIVQRTQDGGAEIIGLLKTGSAFYAPSASIVQMVESISIGQEGGAAVHRIPGGRVRDRRHLRKAFPSSWAPGVSRRSSSSSSRTRSRRR